MAACAAFSRALVLEPSEAMRKDTGCSVGKISLCQVHACPEVGDRIQSLLGRDVTMAAGLVSAVTSGMADGVAEPGAPRQLSRWGWSNQEALVARANLPVDDRIRSSRKSQIPKLAHPCSGIFRTTGRQTGKSHGTTESQVMFLKAFPSLLLCHSSQMLQDRITPAFQVMQTLSSPKIVFLPLTMLLLSQLPLGIPVAPGIRWVPIVFICQQGQHAKNGLNLDTRDLGSLGTSLRPSLILFSIYLLSH